MVEGIVQSLDPSPACFEPLGFFFIMILCDISVESRLRPQSGQRVS